MSVRTGVPIAVGFALAMVLVWFMADDGDAVAQSRDDFGRNSGGSSPGTSDQPPGGQRQPAFTEEQAARGKMLYQKNCQDCHGTTLDNGEFGGPPIKGAYFRQHWGSGDVAGLFGYVSALMPPDRPGQLSPQSYADLTAFLLGSNGYAAGTEELTPDPEAQRRMTMRR